MAVNKVNFGGKTLIDLTGDTLESAEQLLKGIIAHAKDGSVITGLLEAGGGTISGRKFISGEITFSETPTSEITISHDSLGILSQPFVFLATSASAPSYHIGALISARSGSGVYVNSRKWFSLLSSISETIDYGNYVNDTSFTIKSDSATKMLAGKTYIWVRIEL